MEKKSKNLPVDRKFLEILAKATEKSPPSFKEPTTTAIAEKIQEEENCRKRANGYLELLAAVAMVVEDEEQMGGGTSQPGTSSAKK
uniref:Uncharacterized protein n=1 Tax=Caenorhabditis tropicalis TaxID=1561998 RepID=A0A1I7V3F9_9PELO